MAFIRKRGNKFCVVYKVKDEEGVEHQKSETYSSQKEADRRKKEIEYKMSVGKFEAPKCVRLHELIEEYVKIYGHDKWAVSTYDGNMGVINNYIIPTIGDTSFPASLIKYLQISDFSSDIVSFSLLYRSYNNSVFRRAHMLSQRALSWHRPPALFIL